MNTNTEAPNSEPMTPTCPRCGADGTTIAYVAHVYQDVLTWERLEDGAWAVAYYDSADIEFSTGRDVKLVCTDCGATVARARGGTDIFDLIEQPEQEFMRVTVVGIYDDPGQDFIEEVRVPIGDPNPVATAISEAVRLDNERLTAQIVAVLKVANDGGISPVDPDFGLGYATDCLTHVASSDDWTFCETDVDSVALADGGNPTCPVCADALKKGRENKEGEQ